MKSLHNKSSKILVIALTILILIISFVETTLKTSFADENVIDVMNKQNTLGMVESKNLIIPKPLSYKQGEGSFLLTNNSSIFVAGNNDKESEELTKIAEFLREKLKRSTGFELNIVKSNKPTKGSIYLTTIGGDKSKGDEGYKIETSKDMVKISAFKPEGISRGVQTLRQLLPPEIEKETVVTGVEWTIPVSIVEDKPEYAYRSVMIDVARHFFSVDEIKRQIDHAAQYKINKVHLHLSDDQGWRLEIKKWPELTAIGGSSEVGGGKGGYYTQEQFKDIVKYANERYVEIIPEFDMPGHTNAALASYGFLNPDGKRKPIYTGTKVGHSTLMTHSEETYSFINDVLTEVAAISPSKYIHIGGDEADSTKKEDYDYFVGRVSKMVEALGKIAIGWDPIDTSPEIGKNVILQNWEDSNEAARKKDMKMVISIAKKAYLDMKYNEQTPYGLDWAGYITVEDAYKWDPTDFAPKELVLGIESPLWTENITSVEAMDYMIYPRLLGYSEIGWTPKEYRNWEEYQIRLEAQEERLKNEGINYYNSNPK